MTKENNGDPKQQYCDILVLLFCGTTGLNNSNLLGSDESDVVIIAWQLIDVNVNKTGDIHYIYVKPSVERSQDHAETTGITDELLEEAPPFSEAIKQFEQTLRYELNDQKRTCSFTLCTDGQCHVRQVLMPTAVRNESLLPEFFYSFFDLKKEFQKCINRKTSNDADKPDIQSSTSVENMLDLLKVEIDDLGTFGVDQVRKMSSIVQVLLSDEYSHVFSVPERIIGNFVTKPGCNTNELVSDETVVRARGLPWQASDHDVARFFKGLNIARGGVALVLNNQGRRNGEALVRFASEDERELALLRHKHHMGNRYIEVYRATGDEFLKVAAGTSSEASDFLSKKGDGIVRIRGLPFTATSQDITTFFGEDIPVAHGEEGVLFVKYSDGKFTGDAFVLFENEHTAAKALTKHKETLGTRYVEIFKSTAAEVQQVLTRYNISGNVQNMTSKPLYQVFNFPGQSVPLSAPGGLTVQQAAPGALRNYIRLRGMPYVAKAADITQFLGQLATEVVPNNIHFVVNAQGRPSGDAFVQMITVDSASKACLDVSKGGCHKKHMGTRYVEVFQCSYDDMQIVMMGGTLNRNGTIPPPGMLEQQRIPVQTPTLPQPPGQLQFTTIPTQPATLSTPPSAAPQYYITPQGVYLVQPAALGHHAQHIDLMQQQATAAPTARFLSYPQLVQNVQMPTLLPPQPLQQMQTEVVKFACGDYPTMSASIY